MTEYFLQAAVRYIQQSSITTKQRVVVVETKGRSDGEEEIKGGNGGWRNIQVWGCGLLVALRIKQQA